MVVAWPSPGGSRRVAAPAFLGLTSSTFLSDKNRELPTSGSTRPNSLVLKLCDQPVSQAGDAKTRLSVSEGRLPPEFIPRADEIRRKTGDFISGAFSPKRKQAKYRIYFR
ncbi:hypothetical protein RRG08_034952 [Elysia crispata]|uniref:Uncharacterized protein n=1 Tax=Elysia crispata TaxID=231223 RepID=A0AAE1CR75_9GAST|nr:hypothetical protein RRG08_034952 [Elysia crispata]